MDRAGAVGLEGWPVRLTELLVKGEALSQRGLHNVPEPPWEIPSNWGKALGFLGVIEWRFEPTVCGSKKARSVELRSQLYIPICGLAYSFLLDPKGTFSFAEPL